MHWGHRDLMNLPHGERQQWVAETAQINQRLNQQEDQSPWE
jgi:hypothetical protein